MLSGDIAKHQIQDRIRAAEQDRLARTARVDRGRTRTRSGSVGWGAVYSPRSSDAGAKATPTSAGVRLA